MSSRNLRENNSGCYDPVAAQAISHADKEKVNDAKKLGTVIWQVLESMDRLC